MRRVIEFPEVEDDYSSLDNHCIVCGKEFKPGNDSIMELRLIDWGGLVIHPSKALLGHEVESDMGLYQIGTSCAKKHGLLPFCSQKRKNDIQ